MDKQILDILLENWCVILKIVFLFITVRYSIINFGKMAYKTRVPSKNIIWQALGITGFIACMWIF